MQPRVKSLDSIHRYWIYLVLLIIMAVPLVHPLGLPVAVTAPVQKTYDLFQNMKAGSVVWVETDYSMGSFADLEPILIAMVKQFFTNDIHFVMYSNWDAPGITGETAVVKTVAATYPNSTYGTDWVSLGYRPGNVAAKDRMLTSNLWQVVNNQDMFGTPLSQLPLMANLHALTPANFAAFVGFDTGTPGLAEDITYIGVPEHFKYLIGAEIVGDVPVNMPFVQAGQMYSYVGGAPGAAQYEKLIHSPGEGSAAGDSSSMATIWVLILVVLGNIGYFAKKRA